MSFSTLGLSEPLLRAVAEQGYATPTPIQAQAIPAVLTGEDLLAGAQTGTGKTAGFVLPMLQLLGAPAPRGGEARTSRSEGQAQPRRSPAPKVDRALRRPVRALILVPTRELAAQVEASIRVYGKYTSISSAAIFGGVGFGGQAALLRRGVDIVVATPGRLLDHQGQRNVDLSRIEILVLDEADRMLDMGFLPDLRRILALLPDARQNLLFSATFPAEIKALADRMLASPRMIEVAPRNSTVEVIRQKVHPVDRDQKRQLLSWLIGRHRWEQVLVFTRTKHGANKLAEQLAKDGIRADAIHGNKSQGARTRALESFKEGGVRVLVATDIAARGIDIDQLPRVVNYDLPNVPEDYVHRIGRTGRAGAEGEAISLVSVDEHAFLRSIERLLKRAIPSETIEGFEPDPRAVAQPIMVRRGHSPGTARRDPRTRSGPGTRGDGAKPRHRGPGKPRDGARGGRPGGGRDR